MVEEWRDGDEGRQKIGAGKNNCAPFGFGQALFFPYSPHRAELARDSSKWPTQQGSAIFFFLLFFLTYLFFCRSLCFGPGLCLSVCGEGHSAAPLPAGGAIKMRRDERRGAEGRRRGRGEMERVLADEYTSCGE